MIKNRIEKNYRKLKAWSERHQIEAYRLYDRDIPEFPVMVDRYKDFFLVHDRSEKIDEGKNLVPQTIAALKELFKVDEGQIIVKTRAPQSDTERYQKQDNKKDFFVIQETQAKFWVNLKDYMDTGIFLDHRLMRQKIFKSAQGKKVLNLFCYTGSVSVFAALGGGTVTSVDMSATYMDWAKDNFKLNEIALGKHQFIVENAMEYLAAPANEKFDLIFLDPPTFSNSKKMDGTFEVERDQLFLVENCMRRLAPGGVLYFSNNKRKFRLDEGVTSVYKVKDITASTIPQDFHDQKIHHCFEIR